MLMGTEYALLFTINKTIIARYLIVVQLSCADICEAHLSRADSGRDTGRPQSDSDLLMLKSLRGADENR